MQENKDDKRHLLKAGCLRFLWQVALWLAIGYVTYQRWQPAGLWNWLGYIGVWTLLTVVAGLLAEGLFRQWSKRAG